MLIGYARVSSNNQDAAEQVAALKAAGCERIFREQASGGRWDRPELQRLLDQLRQGDVLTVRALKSPELELRPIHHRLADRVRAHVLISLLASYVEWHMRRAWAPLLFDGEQPPDTSSARVAPTPRAAAAQDRASHQRTPDHLPVQGVRAEAARESLVIGLA